MQRHLGRSLSSTYHIPLDLDSLNVVSWSTANRPCRKARETCQKDVLHLARSIFLPLRNLLDAAKKGVGARVCFPEIRFSEVRLSESTFLGCFAGMKKDARWGVL